MDNSKDFEFIATNVDMFVEDEDSIHELYKIASEVFLTLDSALLDFWATDATLQIQQEFEDVDKQNISLPVDDVPIFQVSMERLTDPVPAT